MRVMGFYGINWLMGAGYNADQSYANYPLKLIIATIIYWGTITVFFISIIPIYRLFTIYKGRVNNKVW